MAATEFVPPQVAPKQLPRREHIILPPGRVLASSDLVSAITTVGSGVAVCLWETEAQIGGLVHYLLPAKNGWGLALRCGSGAIPALIERLVALGARPARLIAKIFGGARILPSDISNGALNIKTALDTLNSVQIPIVAADIEGDRARRLVFHLDDGRTWVKKI